MADVNIDDVFSSFLNEVSSVEQKAKAAVIKRPVRSQTTDGVVLNLGDKYEQVDRLLAKKFENLFEIFLLTPEANEEDIKKQFRKLSLMLHPDKNRNEEEKERIGEAYAIVQKAYEELQKEETRKKYEPVMAQAKAMVAKEREREKSLSLRQKKDFEEWTAEEYHQKLMAECNRIIDETARRRDYADRVRTANETREKQQQQEVELEETKKVEKRKHQLDTMQERVDEWRHFQKNAPKIKKNRPF